MISTKMLNDAVMSHQAILRVEEIRWESIGQKCNPHFPCFVVQYEQPRDC